MQNVEFRVVGGDRETLEAEVNELLNDGWTLHGSVSVTATKQTGSGPGYPVGMFYYAQGLTKPRAERSVYEDRGAIVM